MSALKAQTAAALLVDSYPWAKFTFLTTQGTETWACRYLISTILVAGSLESRTIECAESLFTKYPELYDLERVSFRDLADHIEQHGIRFAGKKAENIIKTAKIIRNTYNGRVPSERAKLEKLPGVGRHVASVILATVYGENEFAVDVHVRRITKRLGLVGANDSDRTIEDKIVAAVEPDMLGHFSRSFVDHGQQVCAYRPKCSTCFMSAQCPTFNGEVVEKKKAKQTTTVETAKVALEPGLFTFEFTNDKGKVYTVTVKDTVPSCSCLGWRFKQKCKHVTAVCEAALEKKA